MLRRGEKDGGSLVAEGVGQFGEQLRGHVVDPGDVVEIEDHTPPATRTADDVADDRLGRGEGEISLDLDEVDLPAVFAEAGPFHGMADAARMPFRTGAPHPPARVRAKGWIELMQLPGLRELPTNLDRPGTVALGVEPRGVDADAQLASQDGDRAPRHAALGRHADVVDPAP